ncbi:MAG: archease [Nitrospinae bacterium CG11_big_fil_rev_8_21_14_0_20_56_8]|nr:MAG: archease [Nitrospinae bacterium CG11_big_fil_rev_8_21_14_0_20_56_8]
MSTQRGWEHFHHEADMGIRGRGATLEAAFEAAACALTAVLTDLERVEDREEVSLVCEGEDVEILFVDWLNALIFEMSTRKMLFRRFEVKRDGSRLFGRAWGEPVRVEHHQPAVEVKGASFTELKVQEIPGEGWMAQTVVDV